MGTGLVEFTGVRTDPPVFCVVFPARDADLVATGLSGSYRSPPAKHQRPKATATARRSDYERRRARSDTARAEKAKKNEGPFGLLSGLQVEPAPGAQDDSLGDGARSFAFPDRLRVP